MKILNWKEFLAENNAWAFESSKKLLKRIVRGNFKLKKGAGGKTIVNVKGDVNLITLSKDFQGNTTIADFLLQDYMFGKVSGVFMAGGLKIKELYGAPTHAKEFHCNGNYLENLKGGPMIVPGLYSCRGNPRLKTLKGIPREVKSLNCKKCPQLKTLEGFPQRIKNKLWIDKDFPFTDEKIREVCSVKKIIRE